MIPGILASTLAVRIISHRELTYSKLALGGLLIGAGIGAMHYSGMAAMRLNGLIRYDLKLFLLSVVVAVVLAMLALWIKFQLQSRQADRNTGAIALSAVVMGSAVSGMHYTAMAAAYFIRDDGATTVDTGLAPELLASIVLIATSLIIVATLVATYVGRSGLASMGKSVKPIGLLVFAWGAIAWLAVLMCPLTRVHDLHDFLGDRDEVLNKQIVSKGDSDIVDGDPAVHPLGIWEE